MKKNTALKTVNVLVAFAFAVLAASSGMSKIIPDLSPVLFKIHEFTGYVFFLLVIMHIFLNWSWVKTNFFKKRLETKPTA
jgi:low temperature requirement protein LtrA